MGYYIDCAKQISNQQPLSDEWMTNPQWTDSLHSRFVAPDFKNFIAPNVSRRMGMLLKCSISSALSCMREAGDFVPDAVLTGTGLGCISSTEKFLNAMIDDQEQNLSPTNFIHSTHNTVGSQVAIALNCHSYNTTYSHCGISFDSALMDAIMQMQCGNFQSALVNGVDEMTDAYFEMYRQIGRWKQTIPTIEDYNQNRSAGTFSGENAVSLLLRNRRTEHTVCEVVDIRIRHLPTDDNLRSDLNLLLKEAGIIRDDVGGVVVGKNGDKENGEEYDRILKVLGFNEKIILYKHLFGDSFTMSAMGIYVAAQCLYRRYVPAFLTSDQQAIETPRALLVVNQYNKTEYSLTLLKEW